MEWVAGSTWCAQLVNRIFGNHAECGLVIVQNTALRLAVEGVRDAHARLGPLLLRRGGARGVASLSANGLSRDGGAHFLSVAPTQDEAELLASEAIALLAAG